VILINELTFEFLSQWGRPLFNTLNTPVNWPAYRHQVV